MIHAAQVVRAVEGNRDTSLLFAAIVVLVTMTVKVIMPLQTVVGTSRLNFNPEAHTHHLMRVTMIQPAPTVKFVHTLLKELQESLHGMYGDADLMAVALSLKQQLRLVFHLHQNPIAQAAPGPGAAEMEGLTETVLRTFGGVGDRGSTCE